MPLSGGALSPPLSRSVSYTVNSALLVQFRLLYFRPIERKTQLYENIHLYTMCKLDSVLGDLTLQYIAFNKFSELNFSVCYI